MKPKRSVAVVDKKGQKTRREVPWKPIVIALIVVAVIGVVAAVAFLKTLRPGNGGGAPSEGEGGTSGGLPLYPGATFLEEGTYYGKPAIFYELGAENGKDVYEWYKTEMPKHGWTLGLDSGYSVYTGGGHLWWKGLDSASIRVSGAPGTWGSEPGYSDKTVLIIVP